jgi:hypothetical protein
LPRLSFAVLRHRGQAKAPNPIGETYERDDRVGRALAGFSPSGMRYSPRPRKRAHRHIWRALSLNTADARNRAHVQCFAKHDFEVGVMADTKSEAEAEQHKDTYAIVGELVMTATGIDWQLNHVLIEVLDIGGSLMVEPVIATIDTRLKIEILKERAKHISASEWKKGVTKYCEKVEKVFMYRNIVCHTPAVLKNGSWAFKPVAAAKLLKKIDIAKKDVGHVSVNELASAINSGREALGAGENLLENFRRFNAEKQRRTMPR